MWLRNSAALAPFLLAVTYSSVVPSPLQGQESKHLTRLEARAWERQRRAAAELETAVGGAGIRTEAQTDSEDHFSPTREASDP